MIRLVKNIDSTVKDEFLLYVQKHDPYDVRIRKSQDGVSKTNYYLDAMDVGLVKLYHKNIEPILKQFISNNFTMNSIWYQIYLKNSGSLHNFHTHHGEDCHLSAIYYLKLKDKSVSTEFLIDNQKIKLDISEGDLVLFDASIPHGSPPNNTDEDKVIVSFNLDCR
jgi:hypothetical protein